MHKVMLFDIYEYRDLVSCGGNDHPLTIAQLSLSHGDEKSISNKHHEVDKYTVHEHALGNIRHTGTISLFLISQETDFTPWPNFHISLNTECIEPKWIIVSGKLELIKAYSPDC